MNERACKSCGRMLVFATSAASGNVIPLDKTTMGKCYQMLGDGTCEPVPNAMVSHYATCPQASRHSRKRASATPEPMTGDAT